MSALCVALTHAGKPCTRMNNWHSVYCTQHDRVSQGVPTHVATPPARIVFYDQPDAAVPPPPTDAPPALVPQEEDRRTIVLPRAPMYNPWEEFDAEECGVPAWFQLPDVDANTLAPFNSALGQKNLAAIWAKLREEQRTTEVFSFRTVLANVMETKHASEPQSMEQAWACCVLMASLFTKTDAINTPSAVHIDTSLVPNGKGVWVVDPVHSLKAQHATYRHVYWRDVLHFHDRLRDKLYQRLNAAPGPDRKAIEDQVAVSQARMAASRKVVRFPLGYFSDRVAESGARYFIIPHKLTFRTGFHVNTLVVDTELRRVYNFEPFGGSAPWGDAVERHMRSYIMPDLLGLEAGYTYVPVKDYVGDSGPQRRADTTHSQVFAVWFIVLRLLNPKAEPQVLVRHMLEGDVAAQSRKWANFIDILTWSKKGPAEFARDVRGMHCALASLRR